MKWNFSLNRAWKTKNNGKISKWSIPREFSFSLDFGIFLTIMEFRATWLKIAGDMIKISGDVTLVSGEMTFGRLGRNSTALPCTLPLILSKQRVLTIYIGNPETPPEKSNGSRHGLEFDEMQFLYSFTSVQLIWIKIVAGRSPTKRIL